MGPYLLVNDTCSSNYYRTDDVTDTTWVNSDAVNFNDNTTGELIDAVAQLKMMSPDKFQSAIECFKNAHTRATDEFFNESLSLEDRIMAAKLRIQSRLLLSLEDPDLGIVCKEVYLRDLHRMPALVEIFRYDLEGGVLSKFNKAERHELVRSVSMINFVLFRFLHYFTKAVVPVYDWPLIESDAWIYNPLIPDGRVLTELQLAGIQVPNLTLLKPIQSKVAGMDPKQVAITSNGDLIMFRQRANPDVCELLKVSANEVNVFYTFPEFTLISFLTVGLSGFVYVFADVVDEGIPAGYLMYNVLILHPAGHLLGIYKNFVLLDGSIVLAPSPISNGVALCVPDEILIKENKIKEELSIQNEKHISGEVESGTDDKIQVELDKPDEKEIQGEMKLQESAPDVRELRMLRSILVEIKMSQSTLATITHTHEVVAIEQFGYHVRVFDENGQLLREFDLHGQERESCVALTFNNSTDELVVVSRVQDDYFLSTYVLDMGQRRHNVRLAHIDGDCQEIQLVSHGHGSIALVTKGHVLYLQ